MTDDNIHDMRDGLRIDRDNLDDALVKQPELFADAGTMHALAVSRREAAKEAQKRIDAGLYSKVEAAIVERGEKATVARVTAEIEATDLHQDARDAYKIASREADEWDAVKQAYHQRGFVLRDLCSLFLAGYYSQDSVGANEMRTEEVRGQIAKKRKEMAAGGKRKRLRD